MSEQKREFQHDVRDSSGKKLEAQHVTYNSATGQLTNDKGQTVYVPNYQPPKK